MINYTRNPTPPSSSSSALTITTQGHDQQQWPSYDVSGDVNVNKHDDDVKNTKPVNIVVNTITHNNRPNKKRRYNNYDVGGIDDTKMTVMMRKKEYVARDLYDANPASKQTYAYTTAESPITAPTFFPSNLKKNWEIVAKQALNSFQRQPLTKAEEIALKLPSNPIMVQFMKFTSKETDEKQLKKLRENVIQMCYSEESVHRMRSTSNRNRKQNRGYNNNNINSNYSNNNNNSNNNNDANTIMMFEERYYRKLPGPQPSCVSRRDLNRLRDNAYYVCEKSDGIRFMFYVYNRGSKVYLIDRRFDFYEITHPFYRKRLIDNTGDTLLDGELIILNTDTDTHADALHSNSNSNSNSNSAKSLLYLAFDCICFQGQTCEHCQFSQRLGFAEQFIRKYEAQQRIHDTNDSNDSSAAVAVVVVGLPIVLQLKRQFPAKQIQMILSRIAKIRKVHTTTTTTTTTSNELLLIKKEGGRHDGKEVGDEVEDGGGGGGLLVEWEYIYTDTDTKRVTLNDGLIFTPEMDCFMMNNNPDVSLMKWKFLEKNTIDMKAKSPFVFRGKLDLYAGGMKSSDVLFANMDMSASSASADSSDSDSDFSADHHCRRRLLKFKSLLSEMRSLSEHRSGFVDSFIIECEWNFETVSWEPIQNRPDKNTANFIVVCMDTLRIMMDNVSESELIGACHAHVANFG